MTTAEPPTPFTAAFLTSAEQAFFGTVFLFVLHAPTPPAAKVADPFLVALVAKDPSDSFGAGDAEASSSPPPPPPDLAALLEDTAMARSIATMCAADGSSGIHPSSADAAHAVHQLCPALVALAAGDLRRHPTDEAAAMAVVRALPALYAASVAVVPHVMLAGIDASGGKDDGALHVRVSTVHVPGSVVPELPTSPPKAKFGSRSFDVAAPTTATAPTTDGDTQRSANAHVSPYSCVGDASPARRPTTGVRSYLDSFNSNKQHDGIGAGDDRIAEPACDKTRPAPEPSTEAGTTVPTAMPTTTALAAADEPTAPKMKESVARTSSRTRTAQAAGRRPEATSPPPSTTVRGTRTTQLRAAKMRQEEDARAATPPAPLRRPAPKSPHVVPTAQRQEPAPTPHNGRSHPRNVTPSVSPVPVTQPPRRHQQRHLPAEQHVDTATMELTGRPSVLKEHQQPLARVLPPTPVAGTSVVAGGWDAGYL